LAGDGLEHLTIAPLNTAAGAIIRASSVVVGNRGGRSYGVFYRIDCAADWTVLSFSIETTDGRGLSLIADGAGHWHTEGGRHLAAFDGCVDIDLAGTPFTNTLPIRRLALTPASGMASLAMLYVPFDTFEPRRDDQRYTCITPQKLYRYEARDRSFAADLPVDEDGLVLDYPTLFRRLAA
jgi:hypothetical protein